MFSNEDLLKSAMGKKVTKSSKPYNPPKVGKLEIEYPPGSKLVELSDIKAPRQKKRRPESEIVFWSANDFAYLIKQLHYDRMEKDWNLNWLPACNSVLRVKDKLVDVFGFCDNVMLKDYIEFFFTNYFNEIMRGKDQFYIEMMRYNIVLDTFVSTYDYESSATSACVNRTEHMKSEKKIKPLTMDAIETAFLLSDETLLYEFGLIVAINWLSLRKGFETKDAAKYMYQVCHRIYQKKRFAKVKRITEKLSPYPEWLLFKNVDALVKKIDSSLSISVAYKKNNHTLDFLRS